MDQMQNKIIKFITDYIPLSEEEITILNEQNLIISYKKNSILLSQGELAKANYFVLKGCVRSYYLIDGEEKTTEFYTENQGVIPVSYVNKQPSEYYLSCLEDCILALGTPERDKALIEKIPKLKSLIMQMNNEMMAQNQISFDNFKNLSPELRYLKFMETRPDLINRVPQYHLATYLGITPESLSRIRKRITASNRKK
ncbi:MAG: Crp/Fnr family transcriptional regulator [Flavobacterium sp.]